MDCSYENYPLYGILKAHTHTHTQPLMGAMEGVALTLTESPQCSQNQESLYLSTPHLISCTGGVADGCG